MTTSNWDALTRTARGTQDALVAGAGQRPG
jgi:hypothetical protein